MSDQEETPENQNQETNQNQIKEMIKSWEEADEKIDELNKKLKELKDEKKQYENFIIDYMEENKNIEVNLPNYVSKLAKNFTVHITPIFDPLTDDENDNKNYKVTRIQNNKFSVYGPNGSFNWIVYGERQSIDVEPLISESTVDGSGPYLYIKK